MECQTPTYLAKQDIVVQCGRCAFCLATRKSDWSTRLYYESRKHVGSKFVTLTYADAHLTWKDGSSQLVKSDLQKWFKRVRRAGYKIRYYAVGEYGSKTYRPHYHIIVFGDVPEKVLRDSWMFGLTHIGNVTQASIAYTLKYMVNGRSWKMRTRREPPFALMSRKPGLGANYLSPQMREWHRADRRNYTIIDGRKLHLPRYYKEKIFSKIDLVRIAVRDQKAAFKRQVEWLRHPSRARMADPLSYRGEQIRRAAQRIRDKHKQNLTI